MHGDGFFFRDVVEVQPAVIHHLLQQFFPLFSAADDHRETFAPLFIIRRPCITTGDVGEFVAQIGAVEAVLHNMKRDEVVGMELL